MRGFLFLMAAMACFAAQNVILDQKLRGTNAFFMVAVVTGTASLISATILFVQYKTGVEIVWPTRSQITFVILAAVFVGAADAFVYSAYAAKVSLALATTAPIILPLFAWVYSRVFFSARPPNFYELGGWALAGVAVLLMYHGQK
jgi:drug/metabolite transporter (DMT)-like permease